MLVAALTPAGLGALLSVDGVVTGDVFAVYLDHVLGPTLQSGAVVVLDNLPVHEVADLVEVVHKHGARLLYLPPYAPDFNSTELAFSKLKTWLRMVKARTRYLLDDAIRAAAEWTTAADAKNWFDHCGYHVH